jgi:PAS domain S-box-containing protein
MEKKVKCWEVLGCNDKECPVYRAKVRKCWLIPGTHCHNEIQGKFLEKMEMCLQCEPFRINMDLASLRMTLKVVNEQFQEFRRMVDERDRQLEHISLELALGLSEVFVALKEISSGDPEVRIPETSELELLTKLKHMVNLTAENLADIVHLSHEFAIGLAEHFDVLHRVSKGDLTPRVSGSSQVELLESLKKVTNQMIQSVSTEITERKRAEGDLRKTHDELEVRVKERTAELSMANEQLRREIEERKRAEKELRASEEKYRLLFNNDPNPLFVVDMDSGKILDVNTLAVVTYQYQRKEMLEMSFLQLFDSEEADQLWKEVQQVSWGEHVMPKLWARGKDGRHFFVDLHARAGQFRSIPNGGVAPSLIVRTVDITQRLEREAQLTQASKMATLGEMATGIAHELNQPLNVMRMGADFFAKTIKRGQQISDDELLKLSRNISEQVDRATKIIDHMREFGRKSDIETYPLDINEAIREVFTLLGQQLRLRNIKVRLKLDEGLATILAGKNRLEQIFLNLVTNARDAMEVNPPEATKELTITTCQDGDRVVAAVSDTGKGMSEGIRRKVFEPFFTTKEAGKGTGLGLSITYNLVKDFKGDIEVESVPDVGSTFRVSFPVYKEEGHRDDEDASHS